MKIGGLYSHWPKTGGLELYKPLGPSGLTARWRNVPPEVGEPPKVVAKFDPAPAIDRAEIEIGVRSKALEKAPPDRKSNFHKENLIPGKMATLKTAGITPKAASSCEKLARSKAEGPKVHIGFRLAKDVVESVKASGPNYNRRVEEALRAAGFGAKASAAKKRTATKRRA